MDNPVGIHGIEFVEYTGPDPKLFENLFQSFQFEKQAQHKERPIDLYRQGDINFLLNRDTSKFAGEFQKLHGPSICSMGWRVKNAKNAFDVAVQRGARPFTKENQKDHPYFAIYGIGDSLIYFVESEGGNALYERDYNISNPNPPVGLGFIRVDHLTNNVPKGDMEKWENFYKDIFNFFEIRNFDIRGKQTGLLSKAMSSPCGRVVIPINEPKDGKSQIQEYLDEYHGPGIQHLALLTNDCGDSVAGLIKNKIQFLDTPDSYYEMLKDRVPNVTENLGTLKDLKILVDGDEEGYLLQIFTQNIIGPIFFEIIQRKGHSGFGEGNFQALFDAIERDQAKRGYL
ncbi:MAG: 4-hydroxyphenylpyruvate dioxygenase [Bdellovibrionales bacterium]|nr:4-hydroxyphenylpyruvate dioxygenase [Bdellovibrionales bacterium]